MNAGRGKESNDSESSDLPARSLQSPRIFSLIPVLHSVFRFQPSLPLFLLSAFAVSAITPSRAAIVGVVKAEEVARLTGAKGSDSMNPTWKVGIGGTDLGHMVDFRNRVYFVFGDTFSSEQAQLGDEAPKHEWRWNTLAYTTDTLPSDGITFSGWVTDKNGQAREIIHDNRDHPITNIPTGGIAVGDRMILWYMAMSFWGTEKDPCWRSHFAGLAWSEDGETFHIQKDFQFPEGSNFGMVAAAKGDNDPKLHDGFVYVWGTPSNRCGGVKLARVRPRDITDKTVWRYYAGLKDGKTVWAEREEQGRIVVPPRVGEMSVMYNRWAGVWTMMYLTFLKGQNPMLHTGRIVLRQAPEPWGPWSDPIKIVKPSPYLGGFYGSYMNPVYTENNGETVYFTMSLWDPYDVYLWKVKFWKEESPPAPGSSVRAPKPH